MKKALLLAIAALTVSAAQAVTINYYNNSSGSNNYTSNVYGVKLDLSDAGMTGTMALHEINFVVRGYDYVVSSNVLSTVYVALVSIADDGTMTRISDVVLSGIYTNGTVSSPSDAKVGSNQTYNGSGNYGFLSFNLGTVLVDATADNYALLFYSDAEGTTATTYSMRGTTSEDAAEAGYYTDAAYTTLLEYNSAAVAPIIWYTAEVVPEPTVLALLALGVAGIALKRRA